MSKDIKYEPTYESLKEHKVPKWFHDAKFGIFIHWGLYSVPAMAPYHTYAEWYLDNLRFPKRYGGQALKYHKEKYGEDFDYYDFIPMFNEAIEKWNPDEWADLFKKVNAKYVVLVTKHHDGFLLWPSKHPNPKADNMIAERDIVGELSAAVKKRDMVMGLYYSGLWDWKIYHYGPAKNFAHDIYRRTTTKEYAKYAFDHWYELIDQYDPLILWNDIGMPIHHKGDLWELFSYFYNKHPDGVIDDRFSQIKKWMRIALKIPPIRWIFNSIAKKYQEAEKEPPEERLKFHSDFTTPEYRVYDFIPKKKWECTRGIGWSYGYNQFETEEDYLSVEALIHSFIDMVSKNGNLLLNVGPKADGSIPEYQKKVLLGFGNWLDVNGEAIFGSRPWIRQETETIELYSGDFTTIFAGRYTINNDSLYLMLMGKPTFTDIPTVLVKDLEIAGDTTIELLTDKTMVKWEQEGENLKIFLDKNIKETAAITLKITPIPR